MKAKSLAFALVTLLGLFACKSTEAPKPATSSQDSPTTPSYTLVYLKTGPQSGQLPKEENDRAFAGHFSNMERMALARQLLVAGPFGERRHDPALRGVFLMASGDRQEASDWAATDPATRAGIFVLEYHDLDTDAPLAAALERSIEELERARAEGREPPPGEGARGYVLLTAEDHELAEQELGECLTSDGGVLLLGRLNEDQAFAILDAEDLDTAQERFAPQLENLGPYVLDEWYASDQLASMVD